MHPTSLAASHLMLWRMLESYGIEARPLFLEVGLDPDAMRDADARYPIEPADQLWELVTRTLPDPAFGLQLGPFWHPSTMHALGYAWMVSNSLREGLHRLERYWHVVVQDENLHAETSDEFAIVYVDVGDGLSEAGTAALYDAYMSVLTTMCRTLCGQELDPLKVTLTRPQPAAAGAYFAAFRCPVEFGASENTLVLDAAWLDAPLPTANADMALASDAIIASYLANLARSRIAMRVKARIIERLPNGTCNKADIANDLHIGERTLHRRLQDEGTSFQKLLEETRRELSEQYMRKSDCSVAEVAFTVGFSEASNFTRAFRRWTGFTPSEYRDQALHGVAG